jgi:hypothetical protein
MSHEAIGKLGKAPNEATAPNEARAHHPAPNEATAPNAPNEPDGSPRRGRLGFRGTLGVKSG